MQFRFAFKHMTSSDGLKTYAEDKLGEKIKKFVTKPIEAHVTFSTDRHNHTAHCALHAGDGFNIQVEHTCEDMFGSIDRLVDKLETQLKKHKEKIKTHKGKTGKSEMNVADEAEDEDEEIVDAEEIIQFEKAKHQH